MEQHTTENGGAIQKRLLKATSDFKLRVSLAIQSQVFLILNYWKSDGSRIDANI